MRRFGQASLETIIIFSVSTIIVLLLLNAGLNSQASTSDALRISQARTTINEIITTAEEVWSQGPGASAKLIIMIPSDVNESESGVFGGKTVMYRVLTKDGFTDVSDVSAVNITGKLPTSWGQYEVTITSRDNDVILTLLKTLSLTTNKDTYCKGETIYYYITALDEKSLPRTTNITIQLFDANGIKRDEQNKTTINGLTNGTFIPSVSVYGYWLVNAFDNETVNYKNVLVISCANFTMNVTVFEEDFTPTPYYNYNWTRLGDWDSQNNIYCYTTGGCAHSSWFCDETNDNIQTNTGLIDLTGANQVYVDFWVREETSLDPGEWLRVWCYNSTSWLKIYEEDMGNWVNNGVYRHRYTTVNPSCWISNARFRITTMSNSMFENVYIDEFRVTKEVISS